MITNDQKARETQKRVDAWRRLHPLDRSVCCYCVLCMRPLDPREPIATGSYALFGMYGVYHWCACTICMGIWPGKVMTAVRIDTLRYVLTDPDFPLLGHA